MKAFLKYVYVGVLVGMVLTFIFRGINALANGGIEWGQPLFEQIGFDILHAVILTALNGTYFNYLHENGLFRTPSPLSIVGSILGSVLLTVFGLFLAQIIIRVGYYAQTWEQLMAAQRLVNYVVGVLITSVVTLFFHVLYFYKEWQEKRVRIHKQMAGTASARFEALKSQLDPHFLFNSLNVLSSLIEEDPKQAQRFTTSLSKVYRYVLEQKNKDLVTLEDELAFARTYAQLLVMRFEDSLTFDLPEQVMTPGAKMVPLSLQLLLENAVKHNVVSARKPLHIQVVEEGGRLKVINNLQAKQTVGKGSGVGLKNIRERYQLLTSEEVVIEKSATEFSVNLPLLGENVEVEQAMDREEFMNRKRYEKAVEHVEELKKFYGHVGSYLLVIPALWLLNHFTSDFYWAIFPTLGWGFGLLRHGMSTYDINILWGKKWEERKIRELMEKDRF